MYEIEIPDNDVLLSDYDKWHFVLNNDYIPNAMDEESHDREITEFEALPAEYREEKKHLSWNSIFNVEPLKTSFCTRGKYIQGTFWKIDKANVIKKRYMKNRKV